MLRGNFFKAGIGCLVAIVATQAAMIDLSPIAKGTAGSMTAGTNLWWQDIQKTTYEWNDVNANGLIDVNETGMFHITMHKEEYGRHDYDALKFWVGNDAIWDPNGSTVAPINSPKTLKELGYSFIWDFDTIKGWSTNPDMHVPEAGGLDTKTFNIAYTFKAIGTYDLTASVMCSADLSGMYPGYAANGTPTIADWYSWDKDEHKDHLYQLNPWWPIQGETESSQLVVYDTPVKVPEPTSLSLMLIGLTSLGGAMFIRRKK
jgi:hypothetical protein